MAPDASELILRHLGLVDNIVTRMSKRLPSHVDLDDLRSVGTIGLIEASQRFDPERVSTFSGYAARRIRGAILDELRRMDWFPRRLRQRANMLKDVREKLEQQHGRQPTLHELSAAVGIQLSKMERWIENAQPPGFVSLDAARDSLDESRELHEAIPDEAARTSRELVESAEQVRSLPFALVKLPAMQKKVVILIYFKGMTRAEISEVFGLTESRICQIHNNALAALRHWMATKRK